MVTDLQEDKQAKNAVESAPKQPQMFNWLFLTEMGTEFAFLIAFPLLVFIFLQQILSILGLQNASAWVVDQREDNKLYNALGLLSALFLSFYLIFKKIRKIQETLNKS